MCSVCVRVCVCVLSCERNTCASDLALVPGAPVPAAESSPTNQPAAIKYAVSKAAELQPACLNTSCITHGVKKEKLTETEGGVVGEVEVEGVSERPDLSYGSVDVSTL